MSELPAVARRSRKNATHRWVRWLHVYTSMVCLLIVLFFGITGITLNHPSWTFGDAATRETVTGRLPADFVQDDGDVDFLAVTEYVRGAHDVKGAVEDYGVDAGEGTVSFKSPGYAADLFFDVATGDYEVTVEQQGFVAVMNDLHKGRHAESSWRWLIDVSGGLLVVISATGLGIQLFLRKRRTRALVVAAAGAVAAIVMILVTVG